MTRGRTSKGPRIDVVLRPLLYSEIKKAAQASERPIAEWVRDACREKLERAGCPTKER